MRLMKLKTTMKRCYNVVGLRCLKKTPASSVQSDNACMHAAANWGRRPANYVVMAPVRDREGTQCNRVDLHVAVASSHSCSVGIRKWRS